MPCALASRSAASSASTTVLPLSTPLAGGLPAGQRDDLRGVAANDCGTEHHQLVDGVAAKTLRDLGDGIQHQHPGLLDRRHTDDRRSHAVQPRRR